MLTDSDKLAMLLEAIRPFATDGKPWQTDTEPADIKVTVGAFRRARRAFLACRQEEE